MDRQIYNFDSLPMRSTPPAAPQRRSVYRAPQTREPRIGIIYNPRSHRNQGQDLACAGADTVMVAQPRTREEIAHALAGFARDGIDFLIINGGDGTVRDVLTCGAGVFGDDWPVLAVLPKGKTNALNVDIGAPPDWSLAQAIDAFHTGSRVTRRPLDISALDTESERLPVRGFILGAGAFTLGVRAGQEAHSMGLFDSLAVGMTSAWGVVQGMFGANDNPWRRGVEMTVRLFPGGEILAHSGHGDPARRMILMASTLHRMPLGLKMFGTKRAGLKLAVLDRARRRMMASLPLILAGWRPGWLERGGYHQRDVDSFEFEIGDQFILDGEAFPAGRYLVAQGPELTFVSA
jgi:hypothetical protein